MGCGGSKEQNRRNTASGLRMANQKSENKNNSKLEAKIVLVGS